jgi:hypothetical protein
MRLSIAGTPLCCATCWVPCAVSVAGAVPSQRVDCEAEARTLGKSSPVKGLAATCKQYPLLGMRCANPVRASEIEA